MTEEQGPDAWPSLLKTPVFNKDICRVDSPIYPIKASDACSHCFSNSVVAESNMPLLESREGDGNNREYNVTSMPHLSVRNVNGTLHQN